MMLYTLVLPTAGLFTQPTSTAAPMRWSIGLMSSAGSIARRRCTKSPMSPAASRSIRSPPDCRVGDLPEQVVRLLRAVEIRLLHSPRGVAGIQIAPNRRLDGGDLLRLDRQGVEIMAVIPDMPAVLIEPGDLITHIDDVPPQTQEDLARVVQRHWPGDVLQFRVRRLVPAVDGDEPERVEVIFDPAGVRRMCSQRRVPP